MVRETEKITHHSQSSNRYIRKATLSDVCRIAEIYVFNNRLLYYPIFQDIQFSFEKLQVQSYIEVVKERLCDTYVYDDGIVRGFIVITGTEIKKLHVDCFFRRQGVGGCMLAYAVRKFSADTLWVLEKNEDAILFYEKSGFVKTADKSQMVTSKGHVEFVVKMILTPDR